jgi:DNA-binding cell septation regulator SpoVG
MVKMHVLKMLLHEIVTEDLKCAGGNETVYIRVPTKRFNYEVFWTFFFE